MADSPRPRVLHVLGSLTLGGIETWLLHILRQRDLFSVNHEILLTKADIGEYEAEVRSLGIPVHKLPIGPGKRAWLKAFRGFLAERGPFAAVHSHLYLFSAPVLAAAKSAEVPVRIAHCHTARSRGSDWTLRDRLRRAVAIRWLRRVATRRIGISDAAIEEISDKGWSRDPASTLLLYGFDFSRNAGAADRGRALRRRLGIADDARVIGHVGRFEAVKNHRFLLEAFASCAQRNPDVQLVLVGAGPLRDHVVDQAEVLGLAGRIHFAGTTDDVPAFMAMFDLFVLPSFSEGLGIVCLEAQAAGTRSLVSDGVPTEVGVAPGAVEYLPLDSGASAWSEEMARLLQLPPPNAPDWLAQVEASRFGIRRCVEELDAIYRSELDAAQTSA